MQFLSGCSKSSPNATGSGAAEQRSSQEKVELSGVGNVLKAFESRYELFDVDILNNMNRHNEKNVSSYCYSSGFASWLDEPFARDLTTIKGTRVGDKDYKLSININSESGTMMWNGDVTTSFLYNSATRTWSMSSVMVEKGQEREYQYCTPASVVETLIASLQCYLDNNAQGAEAETLQTLLKSLGGQRERLAPGSGALYASADCEQPVDPRIYESDPPAPMGF